MGEIDQLDLEEIQSDVEVGVVITGIRASLFLCSLVKTDGKGSRTTKSLFNKMRLHERFELVVRKRPNRR